MRIEANGRRWLSLRPTQETVQTLGIELESAYFDNFFFVRAGYKRLACVQHGLAILIGPTH